MYSMKIFLTVAAADALKAKTTTYQIIRDSKKYCLLFLFSVIHLITLFIKGGHNYVGRTDA